MEPIVVEKWDKLDLTAEDLRCVSDRPQQQIFIGRNTFPGEDSLSTKHMWVYFTMLKHQGLHNVLVIEDDADFEIDGIGRDWTQEGHIWQQILHELPPDYDLVMLSGFPGMRRRGTKLTERLYLAQESRVSSMYLVSRKGARNMLLSLPLVGPIDFQINYAASKDLPMGMRTSPVASIIQIYHTEPPMSGQSDPEGVSGSVTAE